MGRMLLAGDAEGRLLEQLLGRYKQPGLLKDRGGDPTATDKKTTIFRDGGSRKRPFSRSPKNLRRDHPIQRDIGSR